MATKQLQPSPTPARPQSSNGVVNRSRAAAGDTRIVVIVYGQGQEKIVAVFADVLGKPYRLTTCFSAVAEEDYGTVLGIAAIDAKRDIDSRDTRLVVAINAHCVNLGMPPDVNLSASSDYEFLYTETPFFRRDLSRFIAFTLGQITCHEALITKPRTYFISTTFPDVRTALSNLDILSVGSDAVEIRVDLLREPLPDGSFSPVPSLSYVGEQVMLLRQRTELPIIFTTRCTRENGRFPMDNPELYYQYLYRAIQWGCEYIDVELWLPEEIRRRLWEQKGNSRIISAFHDFSGTFKWASPTAQSIFEESRKFSDIVKMISIIHDISENYELEYFRSQIKANFPDGPPLSAVNMGPLGQMSRTLNTVFSPITHPLLPIVAAPGQLSAAEINQALSTMGQLPKKNIYAIGTYKTTPQNTFFEKCFNELGLPHLFQSVDRAARGSVEALCLPPCFGGAYVNPPIQAPQDFISNLSDAARTIGLIDTIYTIPSTFSSGTQTLVGDNATWKGIRATLTRDFAPSAYKERAAIILASCSEDASSAIFALRSLNIGKIYTVGFKAQGALAMGIEPFTSIESVQRVFQPFVIISALPPEKSHLVQPLLRHFSSNNKRNSPPHSHFNSPNANGTTNNATTPGNSSGKVFIDLAVGPRKADRDPGQVAEANGWTVYGTADTNAFTTVETLRLLVGQNVPYSFVRLAGGRGLY